MKLWTFPHLFPNPHSIRHKCGTACFCFKNLHISPFPRISAVVEQAKLSRTSIHTTPAEITQDSGPKVPLWLNLYREKENTVICKVSTFLASLHPVLAKAFEQQDSFILWQNVSILAFRRTLRPSDSVPARNISCRPGAQLLTEWTPLRTEGFSGQKWGGGAGELCAKCLFQKDLH